MANQKLKLLNLMRILQENTDEEHPMSMSEIIKSLEANGLSAERKSIYDDIEALRVFGIDIIGEERHGKFSYYVASRPFEIAELKLLVDTVQSSRFITEKKTEKLIKKLEGLASKYQAKELHREVYIANRAKAGNEKIYYNVNDIYEAINRNSDIEFKYFAWDVNKKKVIKHNGKVYKVSPIKLCWDDENYYLIGYDKEADTIKHFRVDKMLDILVTDTKRELEQLQKDISLAEYSKKVFGMFQGQEQYVKMEIRNELAGVIIDRFGLDAPLIKKNETHFTVNVPVAVSQQFIGWFIGLGSGNKIIGPDNVVDMVKTEIKRLNEDYK